MKNILKKIGIIAILIGLLSPFITLPSVNAETETCNYYLNQYLFSDQFYGENIDVYESDNELIGKRNFTNFIYTFATPAEGETLEIVKTGNVNLNLESEREKYFDAFSKFYGEDSTRKQRNDIAMFGDWEENENGYKSVTTIVHGKWAEEDGEVITNPWEKIEDFQKFEETTIQHYIGDKVDLSNTLGGAKLYLDVDKFELAENNYRSNLKSFMNQIINDYNSSNKYSSVSFYKNYLTEENNETYINVNILRGIETSDLEQILYGFTDENGVKKVLSTTEGTNTNSFDALLNYKENGGNCTGVNTCYLNNGNYDLNIKKTYNWPAMYNVEYKVCKTVSEPANSWTLTYDRGVSNEEIVNVTNMPANQVGITETSVTLSNQKPERKDYVFKAWCTDKDGKGNCFEAGKLFENKEMTNKTVYAYWVKPGTENNEKQGVMSYVLGFAAVGFVAFSLYYVINKKNLFKQI